jgi:hypothetical protein
LFPFSVYADKTMSYRQAEEACEERVGKLFDSMLNAYNNGAPREAFEFTNGDAHMIEMLNKALDALYAKRYKDVTEAINSVYDRCVTLLNERKI